MVLITVAAPILGTNIFFKKMRPQKIIFLLKMQENRAACN